MDPFEGDGWDLLDYSSFIDDVPSNDLYWGSQSADVQGDFSLTGAMLQDEECIEKECPKKRARNESCSRSGTKACRERLRREKLNERNIINFLSFMELKKLFIESTLRFLELSSILEPGRPPQTDKLAVLGDAIRVVNHLRAESQEFKETNEKLVEEIKSLKAEKNELREEKIVLKEDKERIEQQLKAMTVSPPGFLLAPHPAAAYHAAANKMAVYPSYGYVPMWQYLPPNVLDTTQDPELRPPAA